MSVTAQAVVSTEPESFATGQAVATELQQGSSRSPKVLFTYLTVNHEQPAFLRGVASVLDAR